MALSRTAHKHKSRAIWEKKEARSAVKDPKITKRAARVVELSALKPVAAGPLLEETGLDKDQLSESRNYTTTGFTSITW
jgi:hypothetical protein